MLKFWLTLIFIGGAVCFWFNGRAAVELWQYSRLDACVPISSLHWNILEKSSAMYALEAEYQFELNEITFFGRTVFAKPYFLNLPSAESAIRELKTKPWHAYYNKKNPQISSLQKLFPFKSCIHGFLTLCVFIYFLVLKRIVLKRVLDS